MKKKNAKMLGVMLTAAMMLGLTACGSGSSDSASDADEVAESSSDTSDGDHSQWEGETLVVLGYGGSVQETMEEVWFKPFEEEYGVTIESVSPPDTGQLTAMGESGTCDYDLLINSPANFMKWSDAGYMYDLDYDVIDSSTFGEDYYGDTWCAADIYTTSICWNTDVYSDDEAPNTWAEFWECSKGDVTVYNQPDLTLEMALLADGVPVDEIYPMDLDRAFAKMDEIKDNVRVWYEGGEQSVQALTSGECAAGGLWVGRALAAKDNGDPIDVTFNESIVGIDAFGVMKGCANPDLAMELIAYCTTAEAGAAFMEAYPYGVVNDAAYELISDETAEKLCVMPEYRDSQCVQDYDYWHENDTAIVERWNKWLME